MKHHAFILLCLVAVTSFGADAPLTFVPQQPDEADMPVSLIRITSTVDGTGKMVFTQKSLTYQHKRWSPPTDTMLAGDSWPNLAHPLASWAETAKGLDLSKAWIVKRKGRDVIALEHTPDGFDLYLVDAPNGAARYEVTIAIPRRL